MSSKNTPKSILQNDKYCYLCWTYNRYKNTDSLDLHHICNGNGVRQVSNDNGGVVWLCRFHHNYLHVNAKERINLKRVYQVAYEKEHSHQGWMDLFHKNYLKEENNESN